MFSAIKTFVGKALGTPEYIESVARAARDGIDALSYTEEEKAVDAAADRSEARRFFVQWMDATQGQNATRRVLAISVAATWLVQHITWSLMGVAHSFFPGAGLAEATQIVQEASRSLGTVALVIIGFYFAAPHLSEFINRGSK